MDRRDLSTFLLAGLIALAVILAAAMAHAADVKQPIDCQIVREMVGRYGRARALACAIENGYGWRDIREAQRCLASKDSHKEIAMSRSRRHTPIASNAVADSDKPHKVREHRRERRAVRATLDEEGLTPASKAFGNPWQAPKDGKSWFADRPACIMRK